MRALDGYECESVPGEEDGCLGSVGGDVAAGVAVADRQRVVPVRVGRDLRVAELAAAAFLTALGVDVSGGTRRETPARMARAYAELLSPRAFDLAVFDNQEGYQQLVLVRDIGFRSLCEHHGLPFVGSAQIGYLPGNRIVGLSKLARVVELFAAGPQTQERMTQQIAGWLAERLRPAGVGVVISAEYLCMTLRGAQAPGATTMTSALAGVLLEDARAREEFFALAHTARR
ncbi:GTP cyclohydrolase I [Nocardia terpenica]|uniref:GTP cyclohydrolase I n=1 Tax=Nocardia terpenica TaxID=455432 RepID=UPI002FE131E9